VPPPLRGRRRFCVSTRLLRLLRLGQFGLRASENGRRQPNSTLSIRVIVRAAQSKWGFSPKPRWAVGTGRWPRFVRELIKCAPAACRLPPSTSLLPRSCLLVGPLPRRKITPSGIATPTPSTPSPVLPVAATWPPRCTVAAWWERGESHHARARNLAVLATS